MTNKQRRDLCDEITAEISKAMHSLLDNYITNAKPLDALEKALVKVSKIRQSLEKV